MVLYLVCFNLADPLSEQRKWIDYWLGYLHSLLCATSQPIPSDHALSKWRVILVGTKADRASTSILVPTVASALANSLASIAEESNALDVAIWKRKYSSLPIINEVFPISIIQGGDNLMSSRLVSEIKEQVTCILDNHSTLVPYVHHDLWTVLKEINNPFISVESIRHIHKRWSDPTVLYPSLEYLHSIGEILLFGGGTKVCTQPLKISQGISKFITHTHQQTSYLQDTSIRSIKEVDTEDK